MTLAASGNLTLTGGSAPRDVATELGRPGTAVVLAGASSDADVKVLVLYSGSGAIVFPADFYGKTAFTPYADTHTSGSGNQAIPSGASSVTITAIAVGGNGGNSFDDSGSIQNGGGGGGGGGGSQKTFSVSPSDWGSNIAWSVGANGFDTTASGGIVGGTPIRGNHGNFGGDANSSGGGTGGGGGTASGGTTNTNGSDGDNGGIGGGTANGGPGAFGPGYGDGGAGGDPFGAGPQSGAGGAVIFYWS